MKTTYQCFLIFAFLLISTIAFGAPFLGSDPYPLKGAQPTKFLITIDGKIHESMPVKTPEGAVYLKYDIGDLPDGTYTATAKAVDAKGQESSSATFSFIKIGSEVKPYTPPVSKQKIPPSRQYQGHIKMERESSQ